MSNHDFKQKLDKSIEHLKHNLANVRTGRATPALVENIKVECYGTQTPLTQLASVSTPDPKTVSLEPWDKNIIEKAIQSSDLGINPVIKGSTIHLNIPALTEERRQEMVKILHQKVEEAKISIRNIREELIKELKNEEKEGNISEDDLFAEQKEIQKTVDEYNDTVKQIQEKKEEEIMTV